MIRTATLLAVALATLPTAVPVMAQSASAVPGYAYGDRKLPRSPVTLADLELLKTTIFFTDQDVANLRRARAILEPQTNAILDTWYGYVGSNPHLIAYFSAPKTGAADGKYLSRVRERFRQWILDTTAANYDQAWLDWNHEIGLRHTRIKKNKTDNANSVDQVNYRYIIAFIYPITVTIRPFLEKSGLPKAKVDAMQDSWNKAVILQTILWTQPYIREGQF